MGTLDVDLLFKVSILTKLSILCTNTIYNHQDVNAFRSILSWASNESYFIFNMVLYKQKDWVAVGSPLGSTLANTFLCFFKENGLKNVFFNLN